MFDKKKLENLQQQKIKNSLNDFPPVCNYLYLDGYKMIFITQSRTKFKVMASSAVNIPEIAKESTLNILYFADTLEEAVCKFKLYIMRCL